MIDPIIVNQGTPGQNWLYGAFLFSGTGIIEDTSGIGPLFWPGIQPRWLSVCGLVPLSRKMHLRRLGFSKCRTIWALEFYGICLFDSNPLVVISM